MTVTIPFCLAFAVQVSYYHSMRKSMVPVPDSMIAELADESNAEAIDYALAVPKDWNREKVEIWAEDDCERNGRVFSYTNSK